MIKYLLFFFICVDLPAAAQTYEERCQQCFAAIPVTEETPDSIFPYKIMARDSCLAGAMAPDIKATAISGEKIVFSKLKDQVIVVNFWGLGCQPCIEEIPALNRLVQHYAVKPVKFISVTAGNKTAIKKFITTKPFLFTAVIDKGNIMQDNFKLEGINPYTIVIDTEGKIFKLIFGGTGDAVFNSLKKLIDTCLNKKHL